MSCGEREKSSNFDSLFDGSDAHLLPSNAADCAAKLRQYNRWRRGEDWGPDESGPNPKELGLLIDYAADALEPKVCCGEFETCRSMCVPRASHFKWQRDELLEALERSLESFEYIAKYGNSCGHSQLRIPDLKAAIASVKGSTS